MSEDRALQHALDLEALRNLGQRYACAGTRVTTTRWACCSIPTP